MEGSLMSSQAAHDDLQDPEVIEAANAYLGSDVEEDDLPVIPCQWQGCDSLHYLIESLLDHLQTEHINPQNVSAKFTCEWQGCARQGKVQTSRSALLAHLRSHTGERPFICPRPECEKIFARMDALQRHSQVAHASRLPPTRKPPTKKRKIEDTASAAGDGGDGTPPLEGEEDVKPSFEAAEEAIDDDVAMQRAIAMHPTEQPDFVRSIVTAAKLKYAMSEHASLADELDLLMAQESGMREEKNALVDQVVAKELGPKPAAHFAAPYPANGGLLPWSLDMRTTVPRVAGRASRAMTDDGQSMIA